MSPRRWFRQIRLSTRLGLTLTGMLVLAAFAQTLLYFKTRDATLIEADSMYQSLAEAIEVAATQIGPEGWKDPAVLADYRQKLRAKGLRDIQVTEAGRPFPDPAAPVTGKKKGKSAALPRDILIRGVIGTEPTNRELQIPLVIEGKLYGHIQISYSLENIREQLADNFRSRLYGLLGVFAFGLAVLLILIQNATKPLDDLAEGAARVAEGRLDVTIRVDRDDEIGRLAVTFNRMTEKLRERQELEVRLAAAEKRAEIGHLASGLAHEIKNPLNALSLGLDVLRRRHKPADPSAAAEYSARIETLREEINRLATLINNFLAFGRP
ncbi:MAG: HAMP domain-containing protein, partial [Thermoanaerobaculia bacterium]